MKNKLMKFNYYLDKKRLKHPFIMKAIDYLIYLLTLYLAIKIIFTYIQTTNSNIISQFNSPEVVVIFASLLGATVGGIITYFITTRSLIRSNHIKSAVINKKTIYEPLHIELRNLLKDFKENDVIYLSFNPTYRTIGSTQFEVWTRIKNDSRLFQLPGYLKRDLLDLEKEIFGYINQIGIIQTNALEFFEGQLENMGYQVEQNKSGIKSFFITEKLVKRQWDFMKTDILKDSISGLPKLSEEEIDLINYNFNVYLTDNVAIDELHETKSSVIYSINDLIKTIELIIITITNNYERQSNLY